ncbi:serine/threonine protein phosphatase [Halobacillus andaensis]|uniref:Phosphoesterase n=1 Tax=Halobacillus andaensis TaxID=1176239 RepID=A0A917F0C6_HALAA|nr:metallophosphoesterase family protein [Halobacillus andaensis]MBP2005246.1 putative phosphoesterase [Halobacillus andaensis]GGF29981.1 serine/threonine protein phosphatase [Halobacillus andaensis]
MRLAFIADIHGNAHALESVIEDIKERNVDQLFVLGDLSYRGLEPQRSVELVQELDAKVIKGNADAWIVRGVQEGEVPDDVIEDMNEEKDWSCSNMTSDAIRYLDDLEEEINEDFEGVHIHGFHATPEDLFEVVLPTETEETMKERLMVNDIADIYVYGHIHKPYIRHIDGKIIINTGSVGLPFDGLAQPSYAIVDIEDGGVQTSIIRTSYDLEEVVEGVKSSDYPKKDLLTKLLMNASVSN